MSLDRLIMGDKNRGKTYLSALFKKNVSKSPIINKWIEGITHV